MTNRPALLTTAEGRWLTAALGRFGVRAVRVRVEPAVPDIAVTLSRPAVILLGRKFQTSAPALRKQKLAHELIHVAGVPHDAAARELGFYSRPERDRFSAHVLARRTPDLGAYVRSRYQEAQQRSNPRSETEYEMPRIGLEDIVGWGEREEDLTELEKIAQFVAGHRKLQQYLLEHGKTAPVPEHRLRWLQDHRIARRSSRPPDEGMGEEEQQFTYGEGSPARLEQKRLWEEAVSLPAPPLPAPPQTQAEWTKAQLKEWQGNPQRRRLIPLRGHARRNPTWEGFGVGLVVGAGASAINQALDPLIAAEQVPAAVNVLLPLGAVGIGFAAGKGSGGLGALVGLFLGTLFGVGVAAVQAQGAVDGP